MKDIVSLIQYIRHTPTTGWRCLTPSLALDVRVLSSTLGTPQCNGYYILSDLYFPQVYNRIKYPQNRGKIKFIILRI